MIANSKTSLQTHSLFQPFVFFVTNDLRGIAPDCPLRGCDSFFAMDRHG
ncbi:hypothetical protein Astex_0933 [Asticcacaulis excentricus CB 48]|uniref:Uncharacterized protein n=1 Tax=Asticcacaulis excentricus (strain ATCC 15261 / DSM 4724 / KCTC 12464 / NCIMB 9791 / VKM B-1370 / CB 48) TaxID=573065 RepID=E8RLC4_ASTEC|nr:hypothetical protein Astex_0933 [Asticcacaulis excentricus CB 48]